MNKTSDATLKKSSNALLFDNQIREILTVNELAERLKISVSGLRKIIARDTRFPKYKVGHQLRFCWTVVESYFQRRK